MLFGQSPQLTPPWTWWPDLVPDLCKLAAGSLSWDIPDHTDLCQPPAEKQCVPSGIGNTYGCSGQFYRANLRSAQFYVCPAQGRDRNSRHKCGGASDFYCAAWGCETTGEAYWNPTSTWDLITVKRGGSYDRPNQGERDSYKYPESGCVRNSSPNGPCKGKYCNPILIKFTNKGKQARQSWFRGNSWGLRVRTNGRDPGLNFKIKLTTESSPPVPIEPSEVLPERGPPAGPKPPPPPTLVLPPSTRPSNTDFSFGSSPPSLANPNPSTGQRLFNLVKGAYYALNNTDPEATTECWLCLSSGPPYYEGIAYNGDFKITRDHASCSWGSGKKLTLTDVSVSGGGPGLCLGKPPPSHRHLCNRTGSITRTDDNYYVVPFPVGWWACNTGLTPCLSTHIFNPSRDFCVMIQLLPRVYYHPAFHLENEYSSNRLKREPISITLAMLFGTGLAVGVGTGVMALVESRQGAHSLQSLREAMTEDLQMLEKSIDALEKSLTSLSEVVLQNRRGLDLLFLKEGGRTVRYFKGRMLFLCRSHWNSQGLNAKIKGKA